MGLSLIWGELGVAATILLTVIEGGGKRQRNESNVRVEGGSVLHALAEPALLLDRQGRIVDANDAAEKLTDRDRDELLATPGELVLREGTDQPPGESESLLNKAFRGQAVQSGRTQVRGPNGGSTPAIIVMRPVRDSSGEVAGVLIAMKDLSEVSHLEDELETGERHMAVGQMTAGIAHDFANVLNTISEAVMILDASDGHSERERALLGVIRNALRSGGDTLSNLRKYLVGKPVERKRLDIQQLLNEVLDITNPALSTRADVTVIRETHRCSEVAANQDELRRALTNLVLNALEAMPGRGTLTVGCKQVANQVVVAVSDTGSGIAPELKQKIFSDYFTTKAKGTGLGLAGARRAVEAQGGSIRFESPPGQGTTFYVSLPALAASEAHSKRRVS
jgi:PAS domain S-box-containing protein